MIIAICDDETVFRRDLYHICLNYITKRNIRCEILEFSSGEQLLSYKGQIDLLLLDVKMDGIDGISVKERLEDEKEDVNIIFITGHAEVMPKAFGRRVYGFLTKPVEKNRLYTLMNRVIRDLEEHFFVEIGHKDTYINGKLILYIKVKDKYTLIRTLKEEYLVRKSLSEWEAILEGRGFYRAHRSFIVNLAHVKKVEDSVIMDNNEKIKLGRGPGKLFKDAYFQYLKSKVEKDW